MADLIWATPALYLLRHNVAHSGSQNGTNKEHTLTRNGQNLAYEMASPQSGEVIPILQTSAPLSMATTLPSAANGTVFPTHNLRASTQLFLYLLPRRLWFGASLLRWIYIALILIGSIYFLARLPMRWGVVILAGAALLMLVFRLASLRRHDFVNFVARADADSNGNELEHVAAAPQEFEPLGANEKIPVHATGRFEVDGKTARFTWLPGFYRTFATREHAIMCIAQSTQFDRVAFWSRIGYSDRDSEGMWYLFLTADAIKQIRMGALDFGHDPQPGIAVEYTLMLPPRNRLHKLVSGDRVITETLYLACESQDDCDRIFADLQNDFQ